MKGTRTLAFALALASGSAWADQKSATDACLMLNNRVLGPRTENRPLPLMKGDPEHGFAPACSVAWSVLSPKNDPLPVEGCFRGSLLQLPTDSACGAGTGKLWIGARWVVTSDDLAKGTERAAVCQQLETGAWAGTRAFSFECKPRTRDLATSSPSDSPSTGSQKAAASGPASTTPTASPTGSNSPPEPRDPK